MSEDIKTLIKVSLTTFDSMFYLSTVNSRILHVLEAFKSVTGYCRAVAFVPHRDREFFVKNIIGFCQFRI